MWPWPRPFIWSSWAIVLTPDMPILWRHIQVYTMGRLSIHDFSCERVAQFNLEWIFSKLDSWFQCLVGFRILSAGFRIPKPRIPDSRSKKFLIPESGFPYMGRLNKAETLVRLFLLERIFPFPGREMIIWGSRGWRSGESARLPPVWSGFKSWRRRHVWVEFVVGSLLCSERFFTGYSGFPLSSKTNVFKFQFNQESGCLLYTSDAADE